MVNYHRPVAYVQAWKRHATHGKPTRQPRMADIIRATSLHTGVVMRDLLSMRRTGNVVYARHIAMYLCAELTNNSYPQIGIAFNRDHTSILHGVRRINYALKYPERHPDGTLAMDIEAIKLMIEDGMEEQSEGAA